MAVVLLLAAAATAATTIKPPSTNRVIASTSAASLKDPAADVNKTRTDNFEGQVPGIKKPVRYEAVIANWQRYRSATKPEQ